LLPRNVPKVRRRRVTDGKLSPPAILIVEDDQLLKFLTVNIVEEAGFVALAMISEIHSLIGA
jgi:hypothetical protein